MIIIIKKTIQKLELGHKERRKKSQTRQYEKKYILYRNSITHLYIYIYIYIFIEKKKKYVKLGKLVFETQ